MPPPTRWTTICAMYEAPCSGERSVVLLVTHTLAGAAAATDPCHSHITSRTSPHTPLCRRLCPQDYGNVLAHASNAKLEKCMAKILQWQVGCRHELAGRGTGASKHTETEESGTSLSKRRFTALACIDAVAGPSCPAHLLMMG